MACALEVPCRKGLPRIETHIPYTPLVFALVQRPRLSPLDLVKLYITPFSQKIFYLLKVFYYYIYKNINL